MQHLLPSAFMLFSMKVHHKLQLMLLLAALLQHSTLAAFVIESTGCSNAGNTPMLQEQSLEVHVPALMPSAIRKRTSNSIWQITNLVTLHHRHLQPVLVRAKGDSSDCHSQHLARLNMFIVNSFHSLAKVSNSACSPSSNKTDADFKSEIGQTTCKVRREASL